MSWSTWLWIKGLELFYLLRLRENSEIEDSLIMIPETGLAHIDFGQ